ncbi:MAG: geranylgeranyl reductase family protein [Thermoplasmata archaeon]
MTEVVVVGAGPAGLRVAKKTAEAGHETLVLEKKSVIGKPIQCAGLVSPRVISSTGTQSIISKPEKAVIKSPFGERLELKNDRNKAVVIDRAKFDRELALKAVKAGAEIKLRCAVKGTDIEEKRSVRYEENGDDKVIQADIVIGADGPASVIRRSAGLPSPEVFLPAVQAVVPSNDETVMMYLGDDIAPGFFLYEVPYPTGKLIGLASEDGNAYRHLMDFLRSKGLADKVITFLSGTIPLGNLQRSVSDGLCLVGDSACQVKPLSGGGIYYGLKAADICSEVVNSALEKGDVSKSSLNEYHVRWQDIIGKRISREMRAREVYKGLSDKDIDNLVKTLKKDKPKRIMEKKGDIDNHSELIKQLLKAAPELLKFTGPVIKSLL